MACIFGWPLSLNWAKYAVNGKYILKNLLNRKLFELFELFDKKVRNYSLFDKFLNHYLNPSLVEHPQTPQDTQDTQDPQEEEEALAPEQEEEIQEEESEAKSTRQSRSSAQVDSPRRGRSTRGQKRDQDEEATAPTAAVVADDDDSNSGQRTKRRRSAPQRFGSKDNAGDSMSSAGDKGLDEESADNANNDDYVDDAN
jgi:hypothetical protein